MFACSAPTHASAKFDPGESTGVTRVIPMPAMITPEAQKFSRPGDSEQLFTPGGWAGDLSPQSPRNTRHDDYAGTTDPQDPVLSPFYADLRGMPPTLLFTSTRDLLLRGTSLFHRSLLRAGNDSQLLVFEVLPHVFWYHFELPETREALELMARFFDQKVGS